ncbi:MAG: lasso peptide biosynthesis B2 protein [Burkholderiales bacterium]|nr:lasso peptide biosynthesis B2 protein [Burkholderiales bacterium]
MLLLPLFWIGLHVFGLPRLHAWLNRSVQVARPSRYRQEPAAMGALVNIAGDHGPWPSTCLTRSLLLGWLLHRRGVPSELRIGVRLDEGRLEAHAWVECDGKPINDAEDVAARFAPFDEALPHKMFA